jgi:hypothetical protein
LPLPLAPDAIATHPAFETAVHAHVGADAVTATVAVPASAVRFAPWGAIVNVHGGGGGGGGGGGAAAA